MTVHDGTRWALRLRRLLRRRSRTAPEEGAFLGYAEDGRAITWRTPTVDRAAHATILAGTGAGKSVMVARLLAEEIVSLGDELAVLLVEPKGDLGEGLIRELAVTAPARITDVRVVDPFNVDAGFPFNLCRLPRGATPVDIRALQLAGLVASVSTATGVAHLGAGARQLDTLSHVLLAALTTTHPRANVLWALDALTQKNGMKLLAALTTSARAKEFLVSTKLSDELRVSTASRIRAAFGATEHLERLISADGCIDFADLTAPGRITIIDVGRPTGGLLSLQKFFVNLIVRLAIDHLLERPSPWRGHHVRLVVDEVQLVAPVLADLAELLLTTGRSRGLSLVSISQGTTLIRDASESLFRILMGNSPTRIIGRLSAPDAELLARELAPRKGVDESVSTVRTRFVSTVTNLPDRHFIKLSAGESVRFVSADVDMAAWASAGDTHADAIAAARGALRVPDRGPRVTLVEAAGKAAGRAKRPVIPPVEPDDATASERPRASAPDDDVDPSPNVDLPPRSRWG